MKLRNSFLILFAIFCIYACNNEENQEEDTQNQTENDIGSTFKGKVQVGNYVQEGVTTHLLFKEESNKVDLIMDSVSFATQMPYINMQIKGLTYQINNQDTIIIGDSIAPIALGGENTRFMIQDFVGNIFYDSLTITTLCGDYTMTFKGIRKK